MKELRTGALGLVFVAVLTMGLAGCAQLKGQSQEATALPGMKLDYENAPTHSYRVIETFPHDCHAFTQGLVYDDGELFEGTGLRGESTLRRVNLETGDVEQIHHLDAEYFGEGIAIWEDQIIQLTWQSQVGFVYERDNFNLIKEFTFENVNNEGWGITHDGERLIMSDGSSNLYFLDPETLEETGRIQVTDQASNTNVTRLNELEYIKGLVYANVWQTNRIAVIDPETGLVGAWLNLFNITPSERGDGCPLRRDVLNGIAYDAGSERLFVTGKLWEELYQIELVSPADEEE